MKAVLMACVLLLGCWTDSSDCPPAQEVLPPLPVFENWTVMGYRHDLEPRPYTASMYRDQYDGSLRVYFYVAGAIVEVVDFKPR